MKSSLQFTHIYRFLILLFFITNTIFIQGQISSSNNYISIKGKNGVNEIILFNKIDANTEIRCVPNGSTVNWEEYRDGITSTISNLPYFSPENNKGYILNIDGKKHYFWVFDYSQYSPTFSSLTASNTKDFPCKKTTLKLEATIPEFNYQNILGNNIDLKREFKLNYQTLVWKEDDWTEKDTVEVINVLSDELLVATPLTTTTFTLSGDNFSEKLNLDPTTITSNSFTPSAVKTKILTETTTRDALNENKRPEQKKQLDGSAPLEIKFTPKSTLNVNNYIWEFYKNDEFLLTRTAESQQYTFTEAGNYKVKLFANSDQCTDSASVDIVVSESQIQVPNIFTPNGDGKNDEFRVAYQSITEFSGTILNRWGRTLYSWNNPMTGWDGKVNGKPVAEGTYFYIIKAKGSDKKVYKLKGHINLLR